jgi:aminoglycoside 6-adenylyltransferase
MNDSTGQHASTTESRIVQWCSARDLVRAAILTSTRAMSGAAVDRFSDTDVILVLTDIQPLCDDRRWLSDFGDVLAAWRDPDALTLDPPRTCWVTQYEDGRKIDFTLWPVDLLRQAASSPSLPDQLDVGYRVLLDKDRLTGSLKAASRRAHIPNPPTAVEFAGLVEEFFLESTYVAKHLCRDDLMPAKFSLDHVMKQSLLRILFEWHIEIRHGWSLKPGALGKGLKTLLPADVYRSLERTYVGSGVDENWTALFDTITLFREIAGDVSARLGHQYPAELDDRVCAYLRRARITNI